MRRVLLLMLALLLLNGCAGNAEPDQDQTQSDPFSETGASLYAQGSAVEQQTKGAVSMYPLPDGEYDALAAIGDRLLLKTAGEEPMLIVISPERADPSAPIPIPAGFAWDGVWRSTNSGIIYYDGTNHQAVLLDSQLHEWKRVDLPEMDGMPAFTRDNSRIYYCKGNEIRAVELELGIDRLIRTHSCQKQTLTGSYLDGKVLACQLVDADGTEKMLYVSSETGQSLSDHQGVLSLTGDDSYYWAAIQDGTLRQQIVGTPDGTPMSLLTDSRESLHSALEMDGILGCFTDENRCLNLSFYNLKAGKKTASVQIRGVGAPQLYLADRWSSSVWFLAKDPATNEPALFRWRVQKSQIENGAACMTTWYDAENPDAEGIRKLKERANMLGKTYGVTVRIWQDAAKEADRYVLEPEHQTTVIATALDELEQVLSRYPDKFLSKCASGKIRICILRSISREVTGAQFWSGSDPYILLSAGCDMQDEFAKALGYVVASRVLGNSTIMDGWQSLNPDGFQYGTTPDQTLLNGQTRAFVDAQAATSVTEDRSRTFWQALCPENQEVFDSPILQSKLRMLCKAIRDAYGMKKRTDILPWEQYLQESIAYTK